MGKVREGVGTRRLGESRAIGYGADMVFSRNHKTQVDRCAHRCAHRCVRRHRNPSPARFAVVALLAALVLPGSGADVAAAPAGYVYYFRTHGQWTVICGRDDTGGHETCTLSAPPPEIHGAESQIEIGNGPGEEAAVTMRVRGTLMPDSPFYLRVDARPPHQTTPNRFGEGGWSGAEAQTIIDELKAGQQVVVRWFVGPPPSPRDEVLSLNGFDEAINDLAAQRDGAPVSQTMPPPEPAGIAGDDAAVAGAATAAGAAAASEPQPEPDTAGEALSQSAPTDVAGETVSILSEHVGRAQLSSNVVNREPVDALSSPIDVDVPGRNALFFFTEIVDFAGQQVTHRWEFGGNVVATVRFPIGGNRWRVYSRKSVAPSQKGAWSVTATARDGTVLARARFDLQ